MMGPATHSRQKDRPSPILELVNVSVVRGKENTKLLDRVSLTVSPGENVAILGPNGAGKTTLMKIITREYYPLADPGVLFRVWGKNRWNIFKLRHLLGLVSNDLQTRFPPGMSGMEVVLSGFSGGIGLHHEGITPAMERKALKVLRFLEIAHLKDRDLGVMSSGEARRFLIGRALVHGPQALILDEPTNSLDLRSAFHFRKTLRKIARSGTNIVLITQNLQDIIPEVGWVILMKHGRIFKDGPKKDILTTRAISALFDVPLRISQKNGHYLWT